MPSWGGTALLLLAGVVVFWPALRSGFALDDHAHAAMVAGTYPAPRAPYDLYNLVDDTSRGPLIERGVLPWWTDPELTIRFFRPLASVLRWADYELLGTSALAQHAHSFLWWLAVLFGARALFRRLLPERAAAIATVVFALAPCQSVALVWLANRSALISLAFGLPALLVYVRFRQDRSLRLAALATLLFALTVAAGEYALAFTGYVLAFELSTRGETLGRRAVGVLPFALPALAYLTLRAWLGYGVVGSGFYADPSRAPLTFLRVAPARFFELLLDAWYALDPQTFGAQTSPLVFAACVLGGLLLVVAALRSTLSTLDREARARSLWLLVGSTLSVVPMLSVVPSARLLGVSLIGVAAMVGLVLEQAWFVAAPAPRPRFHDLARLAVLALAFAQLVHGPVTSWLIGRGQRAWGERDAQHEKELRARLGDMATADLLVVRSGTRGPLFLPFALDGAHAAPRRFAILSQTGHVMVMRRGPRTLELIAGRDDTLLPRGEANLFTDARREFTVGEVFVLPWARATVLELAHGRPRIVRFEFDHELDASPMLWVSETAHGFVDARPPPLEMGVPLGS